MDEYNTGMDPEVKLYFSKIIKSFSAGLLWMMVIVTAGLFFRLGHIRDGIHWYNILFYLVMLVSLIFLIRYLYKIWGKP